MRYLDAAVRSICKEWIRVQFPVLREISLPQLNHLAKLGYALPGCMEQFSRERVQDQVDTPSVGRSHHVIEEARVARIEDTITRETEGLIQI
jgi:hypothetical protein